MIEAKQKKRLRSSSRSQSVDAVRPSAWLGSGFLILCILLGGSSRFVFLSDVPLRLGSIVAITIALWSMSAADRARARPFAWAVIAIGILMAAQLLPLPPSIWGMLPGHGIYQQALVSVNLGDQWRPISVSPDLTLDSLLGLLPLMAASLLFAPMNQREQRLTLDILIVCLIGSAMLAATQIVSQSFYLYDITNQGSGVGLFANRNHEALFLSTGITLFLGRSQLFELGRGELIPNILALVSAAAVFPILIVTGSRAGLITGLLALVVSVPLFMREELFLRRGRAKFILPISVGCFFIVAIVIGAISSRQLAIQRLLSTNGTDLRSTNLSTVIVALKAFFPFGSGFGTFDPVFRRFELFSQLDPAYFNHAHCDPVEIIIEGGLPAIILALIVLRFAFRGSIQMLVRRPKLSTTVLAQIGTVSLSLLLIGSLIDYPLRTPFLAVLALLFATWIKGGRDAVSEVQGLGKGRRVG